MHKRGLQDPLGDPALVASRLVTPLPFALRRLLLLVQGAVADRRHPDLDDLGQIRDPEQFVWAVLPLAARSFAASVVMLPRDKAVTAAVAYLYARMLDTYEDLQPDHDQRVSTLRTFAERFDSFPLSEPPLLRPVVSNRQDDLSVLLIERCSLVDEVYASRSGAERDHIRRLVAAMAEGMARFSGLFASQDGLLTADDQVLAYCRVVIGEPALFMTRLVLPVPPTDAQRDDASRVGEMIQLANITRDVEADLERGIGYDARLRPFLGKRPAGPEAVEAVRSVREHFLGLALVRVGAYRRLLAALPPNGFRAVRSSAVLMLLFTDRHYRSIATATGHRPWGSRRRTAGLVGNAFLAGVSARWAERVAAHVERDWLNAARPLTPD